MSGPIAEMHVTLPACSCLPVPDKIALLPSLFAVAKYPPVSLELREWIVVETTEKMSV